MLFMTRQGEKWWAYWTPEWGWEVWRGNTLEVQVTPGGEVREVR